jgi:predicted dehydrogenase
MAKKQLRVGLIGYSFMGRAHSNAFHQVNHFFPSTYEVIPQAVCGRDEAKVKEFAAKWGYKAIETDWKKLIARDDIDVVDIATPNNLHAEQVIAAAKAGKMILCEKPLGRNGKEAEKMLKAVEKAGVAKVFTPGASTHDIVAWVTTTLRST